MDKDNQGGIMSGNLWDDDIDYIKEYNKQENRDFIIQSILLIVLCVLGIIIAYIYF